MIELSNLTIFGENQQALVRVDQLSFEKGKLHAVIGSNGTGKTTLLRTIARQTSLWDGSIQVNGKKIQDYSVTDFAKTVSYVEADDVAPFGFTVEDVVRWGRWMHSQGRPDQTCNQFIQQAMEDMDISPLNRHVVSNVSMGERKKTNLARSLASNTSILIWDEPLAPLDIASSLKLLSHCLKLRSSGRLIILSIHDVALALDFADTITVISKGGRVALQEARPFPTIAKQLESDFKVYLQRQTPYFAFSLKDKP